MSKKVIIIGSGNAALTSGIAALEKGAKVSILEKGDTDLAGGNTKYTAGAMRFSYRNKKDLLPLISDPSDDRLKKTDFGSYTKEKFLQDLLDFNDGKKLTPEQNILVNNSFETMCWLASHNIKFEPIYNRQSFKKNGKYVFWGGLTLASKNEGVGLYEQQLKTFLSLGGQIHYNTEVSGLILENDYVVGVSSGENKFFSDSTILACGGFEASEEMRIKNLGENWKFAKVRGTPHNTGDGLKMAYDVGAVSHGLYNKCHATPMDLYMKDFGNLSIPHKDRKNYRKICYFLGIMLNAKGKRFLDEGANFRNYTYAQYGAKILEQPGHFAWQIFDDKVKKLLYEEYFSEDASFVEANTIDELVKKLDGVDNVKAKKTIKEFNDKCTSNNQFDPTKLDNKSTIGLKIPKSNWALQIDKPPFRAYPVTGGITFTYGGLKISKNGEVLKKNNQVIPGLFACGELVGGVFLNGYPGGSGLTSGAVFGRIAGYGASIGGE